jgi:hypothetical protein
MIDQEEENEESMPAMHHWDFEEKRQELPAMSRCSICLALLHFAQQIWASAAASTEKAAQVWQTIPKLQTALGNPESITRYEKETAQLSAQTPTNCRGDHDKILRASGTGRKGNGIDFSRRQHNCH